MSVDTVCKKCGEEYDMRHGLCPVCYRHVEVHMRSNRPPYNTWVDYGYLPFEVYGEQFAVTRDTSAACVSGLLRWRATHVNTGAAVPKSTCDSIDDVPAVTRMVLEKVGAERFRNGLARLREVINRKWTVGFQFGERRFTSEPMPREVAEQIQDRIEKDMHTAAWLDEVKSRT